MGAVYVWSLVLVERSSRGKRLKVKGHERLDFKWTIFHWVRPERDMALILRFECAFFITANHFSRNPLVIEVLK